MPDFLPTPSRVADFRLTPSRVADFLRTSPYYTFALILAAFLLVLNIFFKPDFTNPDTWSAQLATMVPFALVAMASAPSIISGGGGIDISVGPLAIVTNTILISWLLPHSPTDSWVIAIPLLLAFGAGVGAINGALVAVLRYQPVIATLCSFFILSGLALTIAPRTETAQNSDWLASLADKVGPIPGALIMLAIPVVIWVGLSRTSFHRVLYSVGSNDVTAYSSGVNVTVVRIAAYALGGLFAAVAGIALSALVLTTQATAATSYTLIALAAVALGGTPLGGGRGGLLGSILGAFSIYELQSLLGALGVAATWNQMVYGGLLVLGVVVGAQLHTSRRKAVTA